jgi:hypothetical protein
MPTRIEIRLAERNKGQNLALTAYVYHGDRLVCSDEIMLDSAIIVVTLGTLRLGRSIQFYRAINPTVEVEFSATDEAASVVTAKAGPKRIADFYVAAKFAEEVL